MRTLITVWLLVAATASQATAQNTTITTADIINLKQAGLSEQEIITEIKRAKVLPKLSKDDISKLQRARVGQRVIDLLQAASAPQAARVRKDRLPLPPQGPVPPLGSAAAPATRPLSTLDELIAAAVAGADPLVLIRNWAPATPGAGSSPAEQQRLEREGLPLSVRLHLASQPVKAADVLAMARAGVASQVIDALLSRRGTTWVPDTAERAALESAALSGAVLDKLASQAYRSPSATPGLRPQFPIPAFAGRLAKHRTDPAVERALRWLVAFQTDHGYWSTDYYKLQPVGEQDRRGTMRYVTNGVAGLAVLAFLADGHTHEHGAHKDTVRRAIGWLIRTQLPSGEFSKSERERPMYNHIVALLALLECYGMTGDPRLRPPIEKGMRFWLAGRAPGGAWGYQTRGGEETSSLASWAAMALRTAEACGFGSDETLAGRGALLQLLNNLTNSTTGLTGYKRRPPDKWKGGTAALFNGTGGAENYSTHASSHAPTGVALATRAIFGQRPSKSSPALALILAEPPEWKTNEGRRSKSTIDSYGWFQLSRAVYHCGTSKQWKAWRRGMAKVIADNQLRERANDGSWSPRTDKWGRVCGRVYTTAAFALCLQVERRVPKGFGPGPSATLADVTRWVKANDSGAAIIIRIGASSKRLAPTAAELKTLETAGAPTAVLALLRGKSLSKSALQALAANTKPATLELLIGKLGCAWRPSARDAAGLLRLGFPPAMIKALRDGKYAHAPRANARGGP